MRLLRKATNFAEGDYVRQKAYDEQPRIALHGEYQAETKDGRDYEIGDDGPKQFHCRNVSEGMSGCKIGVSGLN